MRSRVYLLLLAAVSAYKAGPQLPDTLTQYVHRIWQVQPGGCPKPAILSILQTGDGFFLWLGTQAGLVPV